MRPSLLAEVIRSRFERGIKRSMFVVGQPGLGKTQIPRQVAEKLGVGFQAIHVPTLQPEDCGLPIVNADRSGMKFVVPGEKLPFEGTSWPDEGILVLDELAQADNALQKIMANLLQERKLHEYKLKPGWMVVATGNRASDRAGANRILSHLSNRMTRYELEPHLNDFCEWALNNGVQPEVIQFLRFKPDNLCDFDPNKDVNPTPRAWAEGVSVALGTVPTEAEFDTFRGDVGEGATSEFLGFLRVYRKLPNPDLVLMKPDTHPIPEDLATQYALCGAIAHRASDLNADAVVRFASRLPDELMVLCIRDSATRSPGFASTDAFTKWATTKGTKVLIG